MTIYQIHFERKFYLDKKTGYWISTNYPRIRAHQWVWINHHSLIPKGYHIHHRNKDKSDNRIENLELIDKCRHLSYHMNEPGKKEKQREHAAKIRPLTIAWHKSKEGSAWHKANGLLTWIERKPFEIVCKICGKSSITKTYHQEFCSNACKSSWRRKSGLDNILRKCPVCNIDFTVNKYAKTITCSRKCVDEKKRRDKCQTSPNATEKIKTQI